MKYLFGIFDGNNDTFDRATTEPGVGLDLRKEDIWRSPLAWAQMLSLAMTLSIQHQGNMRRYAV